ncbi:MAG TPA: hypothetical protein VEK07_05665 [Polyangiaceae bacterium]|nr:hypothetical protein [Polyangiaceae bacterium]
MGATKHWVRRSAGLGLLGLVGLIGCTGMAFTAAPPDGGSGGPHGDGGEPPSAADASDAADVGSRDADGGSPSDAAGTCASGSIEFEMDIAPGVSTVYCAGSGSCGTWLSILPAGDGGALTIDMPCMAQCGVCQPVACPAIACVAATPMTAAGVTQSWDGTFYASGTCGSQDLACITPSCAPSGHYVARMCANATTALDAAPNACEGATTTATCVDVDFDWPPAGGDAVVIGTLGSPGQDGGSDAGTCCPTAWDMHSCTFADGGEGLACHDPSLGCATSAVCGEGCDSVVTGRCGDGG